MKKWSYEALEAEALKYNTYPEFLSQSRAAYLSAQGQGLLEKVCAHMPPPRRVYTDEELVEIAKDFRTWKSLYGKRTSAAIQIKERNLVELCTAHMAPAYRT